MNDEFLWVEKYRPETINDCILPDRIKTGLLTYVQKQEVPNLLFFGSPGIGKTTVAMALCKQIGLHCLKKNASSARGIDEVRSSIIAYAGTVSLNGRKKVILLDEADKLTPDAQDALRGTIEEFSSNVSFVLTCNYRSKLIEAIHSRCPNIDFNLRKSERPEMALQLFKRVKQILRDEGVAYEDGPVVKVIDKFFPDYRRTLGELQRLSAFGPIDAKAIAVLSEVKNLPELVSALREKDFRKMRKWVAENVDGDGTAIYKKLYDGLGEYVSPGSIPQAVTILNQHQYQAAFVADQELNLAACLTLLMAELEFLNVKA